MHLLLETTAMQLVSKILNSNANRSLVSANHGKWIHTSFKTNHFTSSPPFLYVLTKYKNTFFKNRFFFVALYSKSKHTQYKCKPLSNSFHGFTHNRIPPASDSTTRNKQSKQQCITNRSPFILRIEFPFYF